MTQLSPLERLMLANQYRILIAVAPDEAHNNHYAKFVDILDGGYEAEYGHILARMEQNRLSVEDCQLVGDVLVMCSTMLDLHGQTNADLAEFRQVGFDANSEHDHLSYAEFLFEDKSNHLPGIIGIINSHRSTLPRWRGMVEAWKQSEHPASLSEADVARIISAGLNL